jgi:cytochrome c biogenesis protein CcmG/thiol:disulfide interchange protein DsbE
MMLVIAIHNLRLSEALRFEFSEQVLHTFSIGFQFLQVLGKQIFSRYFAQNNTFEMKIYLILACMILCTGSVFSQNNPNHGGITPTDTIFPYNIPLLSIDSTRLTYSKKTLAIPQKEKDRKPTVIAFWLTTCIPCHHELATYTANYTEWKKQADFNMIAISTDFPKNFRKIASIVQEKQFPFEVLWDRDRLFRTVIPGELNGLPQVFIFDKNGKLVYRHKGFRPGDELSLFEQIKALQ